MMYYCFYQDYDKFIANATIIITNDKVRINTIHRVLTEIGYVGRIVADIDEFVEYAKDKTSQIQLIIL